MKYKMIVSDFDGTLGKVPHEIEAETVEAIKKYTSLGGKFVICSGRGPSNVEKIYKKYGFSGYLIGCQGSVIKNVDTGEELYSGYLRKLDAIEILREIKKTGYQAVAYYSDGIAYDTKSDYVDFYLGVLKETGVLVEDFEDFVKNNNIYKINAIVDPSSRDVIIENFQKIFKDRVLVNSGSSHLVECVSPNCNKGQAVKVLAKELNIDLKSIMTVGDSTNDIELLGGEWFGVAVGDASEKLKMVANEVTVSFENQPIKHVIEKYCV